MPLSAIDWSTVSALATGGGTLILALATFASVRSANRAARTAERAFEAAQRPVLFASRLEDSAQKIRWGDDHWVSLPGGRATLEEVDGRLYLAMSLRNVGSGIAVIRAWRGEGLRTTPGPPMGRPDVETFRPHSRDLYVPAGDASFWQAAIREEDDPDRSMILESIETRQGLYVDVLYSDHEGQQRTISRFVVTPRGEEQKEWLCSVVRHWNLDRPDPRQV